MDKYLTKKARPGKIAGALETTAAFLLTVVLTFFGAMWLSDIAAGLFEPALHITLLGMFAPFALLLAWLLRRRRDRKHATAIAAALSMSENACIECGKLTQITGVRKLHEEVARLTAKGILKDVVVTQDTVRASEEVQRQAVCAYCGAALVFREGTKIDHCPGCGSGAIRFK